MSRINRERSLEAFGLVFRLGLFGEPSNLIKLIIVNIRSSQQSSCSFIQTEFLKAASQMLSQQPKIAKELILDSWKEVPYLVLCDFVGYEKLENSENLLLIEISVLFKQLCCF